MLLILTLGMLVICGYVPRCCHTAEHHIADTLTPVRLCGAGLGRRVVLHETTGRVLRLGLSGLPGLYTRHVRVSVMQMWGRKKSLHFSPCDLKTIHTSKLLI